MYILRWLPICPLPQGFNIEETLLLTKHGQASEVKEYRALRPPPPIPFHATRFPNSYTPNNTGMPLKF
jgi:hypothetical protein